LSTFRSFSIRSLTEGDYEGWSCLWCAYLEYYESSVPDNVYQSTFERLLSDDPHEFRGLVAADESNAPVGLVHFLFHRHAWKIENVCYLQDLFTQSDLRGQGIARALIEAVYTEADAQNAPNVYWLTQEFNHTARKLYDNIGKLTPFIKYQRG